MSDQVAQSDTDIDKLLAEATKDLSIDTDSKDFKVDENLLKELDEMDPSDIKLDDAEISRILNEADRMKPKYASAQITQKADQVYEYDVDKMLLAAFPELATAMDKMDKQVETKGEEIRNRLLKERFIHNIFILMENRQANIADGSKTPSKLTTTIDLLVGEYISTISSPEINQSLLQDLLQTIFESMKSGEGTETEWKTACNTHENAFLIAIAHSNLFLPNHFNSILGIEKTDIFPSPCKYLFPLMYMLSLLDPSTFYPVITSNCAFLRSLVQMPDCEVQNDDYVKLRLIMFADTIANIKELPPNDGSIEDLMCELLEYFDHPSEEITSIAAEALILLSRFDTNEEPLLIKYAVPHPNSSKFSEEVVRMVNRGSGELFLSCLGFVRQIFEAGIKCEKFFYSTDIFVLIEILYRRIEHANFESATFVPLLQTLTAVLSWKSYPDRKHKAHDIGFMLSSKLIECESSNSKEAADLISGIFNRYDFVTKVVV